MSIASNSLCLSRDCCALFSFLQTLFLWLCMTRHRGRIGYPLSKKNGLCLLTGMTKVFIFILKIIMTK